MLTLIRPKTSREPLCSRMPQQCYNSAYGALLEALVEVAIQARRYGFSQILVLSSNKRLVQLFSRDCNPNWQERTTFADILSLKQFRLVFRFFFVPTFVFNNAYTIAALAISSPMHYS